MGLPTSNGLTVRISGLPSEADGNDVRRFFDARIGPSGTVIAKDGIGHVVTEAKRWTKRTTVTFINHDVKKRALAHCDQVAFHAERGSGSTCIQVEDEFMGLTTLYSAMSGTPNLDIVCLHGLSGHAWDSFASTQNSREGIKENCWLRDVLPKYLEDLNNGIRPRVMTYGYHANVWVNATIEGIDIPVFDLIHSLKVEREAPDRPLIFIGHSLGGIVIKQVIDEMITPNKQANPKYLSPIRACLFLAVPHRGTGNADSLGTFLKLLKKALLPGMGPNTKIVEDLERKNKKLADITDRFIQLLNGNKIEVISCFENRDYKAGKGKIVSRESAILDYAGRNQPPRPIDANHSDCARFGSASQHPFVEIANELAEIGLAAIKDLSKRSSQPGTTDAQAHPGSGLGQRTSEILFSHNLAVEPQEQGVEPVYFKLTRYNTVFLVDDSSSMEDIPEIPCTSWSDTTNALVRCAGYILGARGRLKVHFFNSSRSKESISGVDEVRELCRFIPHGDTPTYQRLKRHLDEFIEEFENLNASQREAHPGLNLIIFTDGAPESPFDDIEEVIVETARDLKRLKVDKYKLGIQFVQIGHDESVTSFFERIDNEIKSEYGLGRDIVDTTRYDPMTADEDTFRRIVLGAIDKDQDNKGSASTKISLPIRQQTYPNSHFEIGH